MKTTITACLLVFSFIFATTIPVRAAKNDTDDNRYFIKSKAGLWKNSFNVRNNFDNGFTTDLTDWQLRLTKIFGVEIEHVQRLYVSSSIDAQVGHSVPDAQIPWGVASIRGDAKLFETLGGEGIAIAVLDTGISKNHPDLAERLKDCKDFSNLKQSVVSGKCEDKNGHGTHVAGIIAADGGKEGKGIYGVAPEAKLLVYRVCDANGSCWADDIAVAIRTAVDEGAQIINLSLGADIESPLIHQAIDYAGDHDVLVVAAAGNDGDYEGSIDFPAANVRVVSVGALDDQNEIPDWSSRGSNKTTQNNDANEKDLQFVAPGVNIESTWKEGYANLSGTSMAAPHISGLAALIWNVDEEYPAQAVFKKLKELTQDVGPEGEDNDSGFGMPILGR
ncbi:MAG: S8 family peptidase, partial [Patescibacteria group bacterium]